MRKVLGLYEAELNPWLAQALNRADLVVDVGANDGYFTFGCASAMRQQGRPVKILAFEPIAAHVQQLRRAQSHGNYTEDEIAIVSKRVGRVDDYDHVTLDAFSELRAASKAPLLKIDVEGAELDVLEGAFTWLSPDTLLVIEVHKLEYLDEIAQRFAPLVGALDRIDQQPLPVLGREMRDAANWWLVSRLSGR